ncbi:MAG: FAD-binding oxidoreductase [Pseudotabrizicola sp.]|uniref:NAD(P)/FAD-dependent oxidoreductase n=1 Tax=Pseudotabrizicola sp. TaxID=2939647 RepID=UPI002724A07D|nr:FAD-binding oxidoreductase [Pseudotabrizicola sp.]MDO9637983.1 FAD-binding oxidoreductase [Pseudotabrizicola sp.]
MSNPLHHDVAIAGAGIVGASVAWHLAKAGLRVAVIDAEGPAAAASGASDGAVSVASKKPGPLARLASASLLYTRDLAAQGLLAEAFHARPSFVFGRGTAELAALDTLIDKLRQIAGPVRVTGDGTAAALPGLGPEVERLVTMTGEGHMPGHKAVRAYLDHPAITPIWPAKIVEIGSDDAGVTIDLGNRRLRVGQLVVALGVSTSTLFPFLPISPRAGQLFVTDRGPVDALPGSLTAAAYLVAKTETCGNLDLPPVVIDPLRTGQFLVGSSRENHADPHRVDFATLCQLMRRAAGAFPALSERRVIRAFAGVRAAVSDNLPIVGCRSGDPRITFATGFEGDGICLSALVGHEVARMVRGLAPTEALAADLAMLSPDRFFSIAREVRA